MHYIRFLKSPRLIDNSLRSAPSSLTAKITITTDLGESFLWEDINVIAELVSQDGEKVVGKGVEYAWKGREGMRGLEVVLRISPRVDGVVRMRVRSVSGELDVRRLSEVVDRMGKDEEGSVVGVWSMDVNLSTSSAKVKEVQPPLAERVFQIGDGKALHIWEETGESIARHIWDAGLTLSSYLHTISPISSMSTSTTSSKLPVLEKLLQEKSELNIIELGAGCGIVSLTLYHHFPQISNLILTDLPEASEILSHNISHPPFPQSPSRNSTTTLKHEVLDWSQPLPSFASEKKWDLVMVADCTYNPDVVPDLVKTLKELTSEEGGKEGKGLVCVAMKVRHESEIVFFDLMTEARFEVLEKCRIPIGVLGGEGEEIEIFVFGRKGE
ncbi:hypothetical protein HYFRA_00011510 [Hymenoscyphus fraxineus]|uniref:S-adenosyl-L-methionine-dependent methyltransferase n=1 Tax=Hymenoscyphus fraxineus TaxID=746836 RepID=A0A9N9PLP3_9HELO|nr:hypothetical protein HYFRA_00011510 [Hymenoscyphus fraxineus]